MRHVAKKGVRSVLVANRSFERAVALAGEFGGRAVRFEDCLTAMLEVDIVVVSTAGPKRLLQHADVERVMVVRRNRPLFLLDISVPRSIEADANRVDNVYLYNIDDLRAIVSANVRHREQEMALGNQIIGTHAAALMEKLNSEKEPRYEWESQFQPTRATHDLAVVAG